MDVNHLSSHIEILDKARLRQIWLSTRNAVYVSDLVNDFDYYFDSVTPRQEGDWQIVDFSTPRAHNVTGFIDFPIVCPSVAEPYSTCQQYLDFAQLQPGQTVIDLGGYSGLTAIAFSKAVGATGRVIVVEPDPLNYATCVENLVSHRDTNRLDNITLVSAAVMGTAGALSFSSEGSMGSSATGIVGNCRGNVVQVQGITLSDLAVQYNLSNVAFVKMDIEGAELDVVTKSGDFLRHYKPRMVVEPHHIYGVLPDKQIVELLTGYGFTCELIKQPGVHLPLITAI
jgi:FkbM family methyltransferase